MTPLVPIILFAWPVVVLVLFGMLPPRRAVLHAMMAAWMFLPVADFKVAEGIPPFTKMSVTCTSVLLATIAFDAGRWTTLRFYWPDCLMAAWILCPLPSALSSGFGAYDGFSGIFNQAVSWGGPYLIGRLYFANTAGLRELALALAIGGLIYIPFVWFEVRMSPQLHLWVYGYHQHEFGQTKRGGGFRPMVFMQHGLAVALFMGTAAVCAGGLVVAGGVRKFWYVPGWTAAAALYGTTVLCKSAFALLLTALGTGVLVVAWRLRSRWVIIALACIPIAYVTLRATDTVDANMLSAAVSSPAVSEEREGSLLTRLRSEDILIRTMRGDWLFGLGRLESVFGAAEEGEKFIPDGLWVIALGKYGVVGLAAVFGAMLTPVAAFALRMPRKDFRRREHAGAIALAAVLALYAMDCLLNAMANPIYLLAAGGLSAWRPDAKMTAAAPRDNY